jgi:hypothetical protein
MMSTNVAMNSFLRRMTLMIPTMSGRAIRNARSANVSEKPRDGDGVEVSLSRKNSNLAAQLGPAEKGV